MKQVINKIRLDMTKHVIRTSVSICQGDTVSRQINITIVNSGQVYEIPESAVAVLLATKSDGKKVYNDCTISGNEIIFDVTTQMIASAGDVECQIQLSSGDGHVLTSPVFVIRVYEKVLDDSIIESTNEYKALATFYQNTENALRQTEENKNRILEELKSAGNVVNQVTEKANEIENKVNEFNKNMEENFSAVFEGTQIVEDVNKLKKQQNIVSPEMFGAVPDGITDCTLAFQRAIDFAGEKGYGLYIGLGSYLVTNRLIISKPITITGCGTSQSVIEFRKNDILEEEIQYDENYWKESHALFVVKSNDCIFSNFRMNGGDTKESATPYHGFVLHYPYDYGTHIGYEACQRIIFQQLKIDRFQNGIYLFGGWNRHITGCNITECRDSGIKFSPLEKDRLGDYSSSGDIIQACQITGCIESGVSVESTYETYFHNCIFEYNGRAIYARNNKDILFTHCWNEANYDSIKVIGNAKFDGGFNISNVTVDHELIAANDVVTFIENGDTTICRQHEIVYRQVGGIVVKGVEIGNEIENKIVNPYFYENAGGSFVTASTKGWTLYPDNTICSVDTDTLLGGHYTAKVNVKNASSVVNYGFRSEQILIDASTDYSLQFYAKATDFQSLNTNGGGKVFVSWLSASGVAIFNQEYSFEIMSNEWEMKKFTLIPEPSSSYVIVGIGLPKNGTLWFGAPELIDQNDTMASNVRVTKNTISNNVIHFFDANGHAIGSINLDEYKDGDELAKIVNELHEKYDGLDNVLNGIPITKNSDEYGHLVLQVENDCELIDVLLVSNSDTYVSDMIVAESKNHFDFMTFEENAQNHMGYHGIRLQLKPNTRYTCSCSVKEGNTLYFGQNLDMGVEQNGGYYTSITDENGYIYLWIFPERDHYQDMIQGKIKIQVEEGPTVSAFVPYFSKKYFCSSNELTKIDVSDYTGVIQFRSENGTLFNATYTGNTLRNQIEKNVENNLKELLANIPTDTQCVVKGVNHRGYNTVAPENTLPAFILSAEHGYKYVETDVAFSKDNVPVLCHNNVIDAVSNGTGVIGELTYAELLQYDFGSWKNEKYAGTKIPNLKEFLLLCKYLGLHPYIEIKSISAYSQEQINIICNLVCNCGMLNSISFISFDIDHLAKVRKGFKNLSAEMLPRFGYLIGEITEAKIALMKDYGMTGDGYFIDVSYDRVTNDNIALAIKENIPVEIFTLNSEEELKNIHPYITGVTTDKLKVESILKESALQHMINSSWSDSDKKTSYVGEDSVTLDGEWSEPDTLLYNWDLTKSLIDTIDGKTATTLKDAILSDNGLVLKNSTAMVNFGDVAKAGRKIEIDIASTDGRYYTNGRFFMFSDEPTENPDCGIVFRKATGMWSEYNGAWSTVSSNLTDPAIFSEKKVTLKLLNDGKIDIYVDEQKLFSGAISFAALYPYFYIGASANAMYNITVTGVRVYGRSGD